MVSVQYISDRSVGVSYLLGYFIVHYNRLQTIGIGPRDDNLDSWYSQYIKIIQMTVRDICPHEYNFARYKWLGQ